MENQFTNAPQGYGVEPKKRGGATVWIIIILIVLAGVWYLFMSKSTNVEQTDNSTQSLDQQVDTSIDSILSDLQSEDATADASVADFSDLYQFDVNQ